MQIVRMAAIVVGLVLMSMPAEAQQPQRGITVDDYMKMDRPGQTMYMVGLIEGFMTEATLARLVIAKYQGRAEGEVEAELFACRWDSYGSIQAHIETALSRVPREQWAVKRVSLESMVPLAERFNAGCPWGKK
jgi:hypothetical protein